MGESAVVNRHVLFVATAVLRLPSSQRKELVFSAQRKCRRRNQPYDAGSGGFIMKTPMPIGWAPPDVAWAPTPAGLGIRSFSPERSSHKSTRIISARTPVPYPRTKTTSCVPDTRLMASKIFASPTPSIAKSVRLGRTMRGDAGKKQLVMVRESAIEQRPTLWSAKIVLHREGKGEASVCPCF